MNKEIYGQEEVPRVPIEKWKYLGVPIGLYTAKSDTSTPRAQAKGLKEFIGGDTVKVFHEMEGGHSTYLIPRNQSFFVNVTIPFIEQYSTEELYQPVVHLWWIFLSHWVWSINNRNQLYFSILTIN